MANNWGNRAMFLSTIIRMSQGERMRFAGDLRGMLGARRVGGYLRYYHRESGISIMCKILQWGNGILVEACGPLEYAT